ncbi:MAG: hypothetical protein Q9157_009208 [Trypethelium eluteriae]
MEGLRERIRELEGAVRWLREDNRRARVVEPAMQSRVGAPKMDWLAEPLLSKTRTPEQQRRETVKAEGKEVLSELLELVDGAKPVDLSALPENKLAWQPAREKPRFQLLKQAEDYEAWAAWRDEVLKQAKGLRNREQVKMQARQTGKVAARVNFLLPTLPSEKVQDTAVRIVEPGEFDDLKEAIGVA